MTAATAMDTAVRLRVIFEDDEMLSKSKKKEGLNRCWVLLKPKEHCTVSHFSSHLHSTFNLHRSCPNGIILSMEGFVLPPFESTYIFKDKDIVYVQRKGSISTNDNRALLPCAPNGGSIKLLKLLAIEGFQGEDRQCQPVLQEDESNQLEEDAGNVESNANSEKRKASKKLKSLEDENDQLEDDAINLKSNAISMKRKKSKKLKSQENESVQLEDVGAVYAECNVNSKKRKASKTSKSPSKKKSKLSSTEKLAVIPEEEEENESFEDRIHHRSVVKKDNEKSSKLSSQPKKSSILDCKQSKNSSGSRGDKTRSLRLQDDDGTEIKKMPSRSTRRKKAKRRWLREQKLQQENQKPHPSPVVEKDGQRLPIKDYNGVVSDAHPQTDEISETEDDIAPVEIRPGHIRFEPLRKDQEVQQNHFPVEMLQWNGTTSKKGRKWGTEKISSHKQVDYEDGIHESPNVHHAEKQHTLIPVDFDKLTPYTSSPKEGDVISYRLIELSASWTPELSSFRVGKILHYDAKSNRIQLEPVSEHPFDFKKKIDEDESSEQFDPSPYGEDGSLEIDYLSLADVRMVKHGKPDSATVIAPSGAWDNLVKATNGHIDEKLAWGIPIKKGKVTPLQKITGK